MDKSAFILKTMLASPLFWGMCLLFLIWAVCAFYLEAELGWPVG
jgi:hypothetical protein